MPIKTFGSLSFTLVTVAGIGALGFSKPASACSCAQEVNIRSSAPADGAEDVPLDATLVAQVSMETALVLFGEDDQEVPTTQKAVSHFDGFCSNSYEIVPNAELLPNHNYRLMAVSAAEEGFETDEFDVVSFTTGAATAEVEAAPAPTVKFAVFTSQTIDSCTESALRACLEISSGQVVEMNVEHDDEVRRYIDTTKAMNLAPLGDVEGEVCVSIHTRDLAGNLSAPFEHCFERDDVYELTAEDEVTIYSPCESAEVQALLNGEIPVPPDAGPAAPPPVADAGPLPAPEADGGNDAGEGPMTSDVVVVTSDVVVVTSDVGKDTDEDGISAEVGAADAAVRDDDSSDEDDDKPPVASEPDDSGCSVTAPGSNGAGASFGMLLTAFAVVLGRRVSRRK